MSDDQRSRITSLLWDFLLTVPPNLRHAVLADLREKLERMPSEPLYNDAAMWTAGELMAETWDRR